MSQAARLARLKRLSHSHNTALTICYGRRYLRAFPEDGLAWLYVGIALVEVARYEEAEQAIARAISLCPTEMRHHPLSHMGHLFREAGDYDQAAEWYRRAIAAGPDLPHHYIFLGALLAKQGRFADAEEAHRNAIACPEGELDEAYLNLGFVLRAREQFVEAAECFREALRLDPEYRAARRALHDVERCIRYKH
ncbi:tetratricopeptide repeat protein [Lacipirellula sp.]|uniref:tetratricopeptide repeat protein n=1 Tax=Lacipirellula sp. TaxID=2691419 RepID=UPI003D0A83D9